MDLEDVFEITQGLFVLRKGERERGRRNETEDQNPTFKRNAYLAKRIISTASPIESLEVTRVQVNGSLCVLDGHAVVLHSNRGQSAVGI